MVKDINFNFGSIFILFGLGQALFLAIFYISRHRRPVRSDILLSGLLLCFSLNLMEIFYCYSNLAFTNLWVVDLAEPANFLMVVLYYFMVRSKLEDSPIKVSILHFLPFLAYLIFMLFHFYFKPAPIKYSAYVDAYHPDILNFFWEENKPYWIIWVRKYKDVIMVVQIIIYLVFLILYLRKIILQKNLRWLQAEGNLKWALQSLAMIIFLTLLFIFVKSIFKNDKGDFLIGIFMSVIIYILSFSLLSKSIAVGKDKSK